MGVYLGTRNFDRDIEKLPTPPQIINDPQLPLRAFLDQDPTFDIVKALMVTECKDDYIDSTPTCQCGFLKARYHVAKKGFRGTVCPNCESDVQSPMIRGFVSDTWIQVPEGVDSFILPVAYGMLREMFVQADFNAIEYLINHRYEVKNPNNRAYQRFLDLGISRGYNHFLRNFWPIIDTLMEQNYFGGCKLKRRSIYRYLTLVQDSLFPKIMPLPSKRSIITEESNKAKYAVDGYAKAIDAARTLYDLMEKEERRKLVGGEVSIQAKEYHVVKAMQLFNEYHVFTDRAILCKKEGWYRKQIFGTRVAPSYRGVVISIADVHEYDEIRMPWKMAIATYRTMLISKLEKKYSLTQNECEGILIRALNQFDPQIDEIFEEIIAESFAATEAGTAALATLLGRNPTLNLRSIQALAITKIKKDIHDNTISISLLILAAPNCDFDGDNLNGTPILSRADWDKARMLHPSTGINYLNRPRSFNNNMQLGKPILSTINNLIYGDD